MAGQIPRPGQLAISIRREFDTNSSLPWLTVPSPLRSSGELAEGDGFLPLRMGLNPGCEGSY
jgi:hypothetical protein